MGCWEGGGTWGSCCCFWGGVPAPGRCGGPSGCSGGGGGRGCPGNPGVYRGRPGPGDPSRCFPGAAGGCPSTWGRARSWGRGALTYSSPSPSRLSRGSGSGSSLRPRAAEAPPPHVAEHRPRGRTWRPWRRHRAVAALIGCRRRLSVSGGRGPDSSQRGCRTSRPPVHESGPPPVPESGPAPRPSPAPVPPRPVPEPPARYRRSATPSPFPGSPRHRYRPALCGSPRPIPRIEPGHPLPPIPARYRHRLRTQAGMGVGGFWGTRGHLGRHGRAWGDMVGLGGTEGHGGIRGHLGGTWGLWGFGRHRDMGGHGDIWGGFGGQVIMGGVQGTWWYYEHG